jgi:signal transduction histidine kinase
MEQKDLVFLIFFISIFLIIFVGGGILYILQSKRKKIENIKEKEKLQTMHQQELLSTQIEMQQQTMQHIGREIHDNVGQKLTLASLYTQQLSFENKAPQINDKIENISTILNESLQELRRLSKTLIDDTIAENNIVDLLEGECHKIKAIKFCNVLFTTSQKNMDLSYSQKNVLLRVVQEFLQNSIKHSKCTEIAVSIVQENNFVKLFLKDDGVGFEMENKTAKGIGLKNIAKRIQLLYGTYDLTSNIDKGTALQIQIPIQHEA